MATTSEDAKGRIARGDSLTARGTFDKYDRIEKRLRRTWSRVLTGEAGETGGQQAVVRQRDRTKVLSDDIAMNARRAMRLPRLRERVMGARDFLGIDYLARGLVAARSVGRIDGFHGWQGTGFLVSPDLVLTNQHVLSSPTQAGDARIGFEPGPQHAATCGFDPGRFWFSSEALDVTVVALEETEAARALTEPLGWHPIIGQQGKITLGDPVAIVQYPKGGAKSVVLHNSTLLHIEDGGDLDAYCWYTSDTEPGSSGSPVFNRHWEVVAVHHQSVPKTNDDGEIVGRDGAPLAEQSVLDRPELAVWIANQGVRASRIAAALAAHDFSGRSDHAQVRDGLLHLWDGASLRNAGQEDPLREMLHAIADAPDLAGASLAPGAEVATTGSGVTVTVRVGR